MKKPFCFAAMFVAIATSSLWSQELVQGPYGVDGTWNIYELGDDLATWAEAVEDAQSKTREGVTGDLASIHSFEENQVISDLALNGIVWIGATDREGAAPLVEQNDFMSPQESIQLVEEEFFGAENVEEAKFAGWAWTSGEPFCFHNWAGGEPNNWDGTAAGDAENGFEDATFLRADGLWNDAPSGYAENEPVVPTLQPGTSVEERDDLPNERLYDYVIEYRTNSPTPFPDIEEVGDDPVFDEPTCQPIIVDPGDHLDFDGDGSYGVGDVDLLRDEIKAGTNNASFDVTGDGSVNNEDLVFYVEDASVLNTYLGDANLDGEFNSSDFVTVFSAGEYEDEIAMNSTWAEGDWNADGDFSSSDFVAAFSSGGYEKGPKPAAVPEPSGIALLAIGAVLLYRRRV